MAAPSISVGDIVTFRVWFTESEQAAVNTFHWLCDLVSGAGATTQDAAFEFDALLGTSFKTIINNNATYNGVQVYVNHLPLPAAVDSIVNSGPGTGGATANSRQTAGITRWLTPFAGPAYRGRTYWPFPSTAEDAAGGIPNAGYLTALGSIATAMLGFTSIGTGANTSGGNLCIRHGKNKAGSTPPPTLITSNLPVPKWATQKRRGSYGRPNASPI